MTMRGLFFTPSGVGVDLIRCLFIGRGVIMVLPTDVKWSVFTPGISMIFDISVSLSARNASNLGFLMSSLSFVILFSLVKQCLHTIPSEQILHCKRTSLNLSLTVSDDRDLYDLLL